MLKLYSLLAALLLFAPLSFAQTNCSSSHKIIGQDIYHKSQPLGVYSIDLAQTLNAIKRGVTSYNSFPYFKKNFYSCTRLFPHASVCYEYTVYPDRRNFVPDDIEKKLTTAAGGSDRGPVRIVTDGNTATMYKYTADHYESFCGPYPLN